MSFSLRKFIGGAAEGAGQVLAEQRREDFVRERDAVLAANKEKLIQLRAQSGGAGSSTLAEMEHLNSIKDKAARKAAYDEMLALKRGGFAHGEQRYDSAGNVIVDADTTATNVANVAAAKEDAVLNEQLKTKPKIAQAEANVKNASDAAKEAYKDLSVANEKISVYDEAIAALDSGAGTGAIEKYLPSIKSASIKLDNAKQRLGLKNLQSFKGSTTERELNISLSTAVPDGLNEAELKSWLQEKKQDQQRVAGILTEAVQFLETGTLGEWLQQREKPKTSEYGESATSDEELLKKYGIY